MNGFEKVVVDIGKGIEWPFVHAAELTKLLSEALKDEPAVKAAVVGLVQEIGLVTADGAIVVSSAGVNVTADMAELVAMKALWTYIAQTFLPAVETAWKDIRPEMAALESAGGAPPAQAPAAAVDPAPGLHSVVPQ